MTNGSNRMTKQEALDVLKSGGTLSFESWTWSKDTYQCWGNGEDGIECCYESFTSAEESLEHLLGYCGRKWDGVEHD